MIINGHLLKHTVLTFRIKPPNFHIYFIDCSLQTVERYLLYKSDPLIVMKYLCFYQTKLALDFFTFFVHFKSNIYFSTTGRIVVSLFYATSFIDSDQFAGRITKDFLFYL